MSLYSEYKGLLKISLSLKDEVPPKDYDSVRERLIIPEKQMNSGLLSNYFFDMENLRISKEKCTEYHPDKSRNVKIKSNKRKMTLEVSVSSTENLSQDELLNVENLNRFILTGEYPKD